MSEVSEKPDSLDEVNNFIPRRFSLDERLTCLAYLLGRFAPTWVKSASPPHVSKSQNTAFAVQDDDTCVVKHLTPSSWHLCTKVWSLSIDANQKSKIAKAMRHPSVSPSGEYEKHLGDLLNSIGANKILDDGERAYREPINGVLKVLIPLVRITVLQLWIQSGIEDESKLTDIAYLLMGIHSREDFKKSGTEPDHSIFGRQKPNSEHNFKEGYLVATIDRKGKEFVEYEFEKSSCLDQDKDTKDKFITYVVNSNLPLNKMLDKIRGKKPDPKFKGGWQAQVLHLLAQVSTLFFILF